MITAPYNFVPLNKEVFYPEWSDKVSHDIPFEDGISGEIEVQIEAKSPIFIKDNTDIKEFCHFEGKRYIPGSSLKGMIRTLVEVISFSKLSLQDKKLSYRDLNNPAYKKKAMNQNKIYMGWLKKDKDRWIIESLGKVTALTSRIKYSEMKNCLTEDEINTIKRKKEAFEKYKVIEDLNKLQTPRGTIVFTGSTGKKTREFLFPNSVYETYILEKDVVQTFLDAYYINTPNENLNWKNLWKEKLNNGGKVPIFFQMNHNKILHFGLSMLYKLPYENSLQELLENYQNYKNEFDMAETIFGSLSSEKELKGRVYFSHLKCVKEVKSSKEAKLPLSSPRPTFFPNYIVQNHKNGKAKFFITYDDNNAILRGFKFYPPKKQIIYYDEICQQNNKLCTSFKPLDVGSIFQGKIKFHNLKRSEIGALLSALTFFKQDGYFHKIGMAKAYGFGTVKVKIKSYSLDRTVDDYINEFITIINKNLNIDLVNHSRIKTLLQLSSYELNEKFLQVMNLKQFICAKKPSNKWVLQEVTIPKETNNSITKEKKLQNPVVAEYSIVDIAKEVKKTSDEVIKFILSSSLPIKKDNLNKNTILKEAQAKGIINKIKQQ